MTPVENILDALKAAAHLYQDVEERNGRSAMQCVRIAASLHDISQEALSGGAIGAGVGMSGKDLGDMTPEEFLQVALTSSHWNT